MRSGNHFNQFIFDGCDFGSIIDRDADKIELHWSRNKEANEEDTSDTHYRLDVNLSQNVGEISSGTEAASEVEIDDKKEGNEDEGLIW
jgi:hypothetical protein